MNVGISIQYNISVSPDEFRLISRALRSKLNEQERVAALKLQTELQASRARVADQLAEQCAEHALNAEEAPK